MLDMRLVRIAREEAESALLAYAKALREWNDPDDAHTRLTLRHMIEETIAEAVPYK